VCVCVYVCLFVCVCVCVCVDGWSREGTTHTTDLRLISTTIHVERQVCVLEVALKGLRHFNCMVVQRNAVDRVVEAALVYLECLERCACKVNDALINAPSAPVHAPPPCIRTHAHVAHAHEHTHA
jgi:hypothetical protein